jgi:hypothetical protein
MELETGQSHFQKEEGEEGKYGRGRIEAEYIVCIFGNVTMKSLHNC